MRGFAAVAAVMVLAHGAIPAEAQTERREIRLAGRTDDRPFSDAVLVGRTFYLAGRTGHDAKTGKRPTDAADEVRAVLDQIKAVLGQAGMTMDHLGSGPLLGGARFEVQGIAEKR